MFEQALMPNAHTKPWSLGASITLQAAIAGTMVLYSAMHVELLPVTPPHLAVPMPPVPRREFVEVVAAIIEHRPGTLASPVRSFTEPSKIPTAIADVDDIGSPAPAIASSSLSPALEIVGSVIGGGVGLKLAPPPPPEPATEKATNNAAPVRVGGQVMEAKILTRVVPGYPPLARSMRVAGKVHLIGIISKTGVIEKLEVVDGHPLLVRAALEAVRQWIYRPTMLNGEAVDVITPIEVNFTLTQ